MARAAQIYEVVLTANQSQTLLVEGSFFKILSATGTVNVGRDGGSTLKNLVPGQGEQGVEFKRLQFTDTSGAGNTVTVVVADNTFIDDRVFGTVSVVPSAGASSHTAMTVTTVAAGLFSANSSRRYLLMQNRGAGNIYFRFDGGTPTAANGFLLPPGGIFEASGPYVPSGAVVVLSDVASCALYAAQG